ncbi:MAG: DUF4405 domain-containing protein [Christensenella sp.]|nr:DUF4405 domain-containing protein [Christensenella sp.]
MEPRDKTRLTAKTRRLLKLTLDAIMLVLLALMYRKQAISIAFHEIGGLALIGLFLIHHLVNAKWIGSATRKLFHRGMPALVRARYIVDALLLAAFLAVGVTGVLISKVVFSLHVQGNFKMLHDFSAALAVILMGVHLGLHADSIFGRLLRRDASKAARAMLCIGLAAMIAFGAYSLFTTSFIRLLTAPLQSASMAHREFRPSGEIALDGSSGERPNDLSELPELSSGSGVQPSQSGAGGSGQNPGSDGQGGALFGGEGRNGAQGESEAGNAAVLIAQYVCIIVLFGAATYGVAKQSGRRKRRAQNREPGEIVVVEENDASGAS